MSDDATKPLEGAAPCSMHAGDWSPDCAMCAIPVHNLGRYLHEWAAAFGLSPGDAVRIATIAVAGEATAADFGAKQFGRLALDTYRALQDD